MPCHAMPCSSVLHGWLFGLDFIACHWHLELGRVCKETCLVAFLTWMSFFPVSNRTHKLLASMLSCTCGTPVPTMRVPSVRWAHTCATNATRTNSVYAHPGYKASTNTTRNSSVYAHPGYKASTELILFAHTLATRPAPTPLVLILFSAIPRVSTAGATHPTRVNPHFLYLFDLSDTAGQVSITDIYHTIPYHTGTAGTVGTSFSCCFLQNDHANDVATFSINEINYHPMHDLRETSIHF